MFKKKRQNKVPNDDLICGSYMLHQYLYSAGPVIGLPAHRANPVIGPSKGLHQVSAITRELRETIGGFKRQEYDFGDTNASEFIF